MFIHTLPEIIYIRSGNKATLFSDLALLLRRKDIPKGKGREL